MKTNQSIIFLSLCIMPVLVSGHGQESFENHKKQIPNAKELIKNQTLSGNPENSESAILFQEFFEDGAGNWTRSGCWQSGHPASGPYNGYNSSNCAATNLSGNYGNNANDWLISPEINLPAQVSMIQLNFYEWFFLEPNYDFGRVKISTDQGSGWTQLVTSNGSSDWRLTSIDLTAFNGQNIKLGFNLTSDGSLVRDGWYVDEVSILVTYPEPLSAVVQSINSRNFPQINLNLKVMEFGEIIPTLNSSEFQVLENGQTQADSVQITPPFSGGDQRLADLVFIIDNSGSMDQLHLSMKNNMPAFLEMLTQNGVNTALGLCRFGQNSNNGNPFPEDFGQLTPDANHFMNEVWLRNVSNGSREPGFYAITQSTSGFCFRPGTQKILIIVTDENPDQGGANLQQTITICKNAGITLFCISSPESASLNQVAEATNGAHFDINEPVCDIFSKICEEISSTYLICYQSSMPECDGVQRNMEIEIHHNGNQCSATGFYWPCTGPAITRTASTTSLEILPIPEYTPIDLEVEVEDNNYPFVNQVSLFYKKSTDLVYQTIGMTNMGGILWQGSIPESAVLAPGIDYYITASDGSITVADPETLPASSPHHIAIVQETAFIRHAIVEKGSYHPGEMVSLIIEVDTYLPQQRVVVETVLFDNYLDTVAGITNNIQLMSGEDEPLPVNFHLPVDALSGTNYSVGIFVYDSATSDRQDSMFVQISIEGAAVMTHCMQAGWQMISAYLIPENTQIESVMADLGNQEAFSMMMNRNGVYWPGQNVNTIINWDIHSAYKIKMTKPGCLNIMGNIPQDKTINLFPGVNYLPVLDDEPVSAATILSQVSGMMTYAIDIQENLLYWPAGGIFTLQTLIPGKGYMVIMQGNGQVTFP